MKKVILAVLLLSIGAAAQTAHYADLNWTASQGATGYNVYRAPCTTVVSGACTVGEGPYVKIAAVSVFTYRDTTVTAGGKYVYYVTATAVGFAESNPSNRVAVTIPLDQLPAPVLGPVTVALSTSGANQNILAQWSISPAQATSYSLRDASNALLASGTTASGTDFSVSFVAKKRPTPFTMTVCAGSTCNTGTSTSTASGKHA